MHHASRTHISLNVLETSVGLRACGRAGGWVGGEELARTPAPSYSRTYASAYVYECQHYVIVYAHAHVRLRTCSRLPVCRYHGIEVYIQVGFLQHDNMSEEMHLLFRCRMVQSPVPPSVNLRSLSSKTAVGLRCAHPSPTG